MTSQTPSTTQSFAVFPVSPCLRRVRPDDNAYQKKKMVGPSGEFRIFVTRMYDPESTRIKDGPWFAQNSARGRWTYSHGPRRWSVRSSERRTGRGHRRSQRPGNPRRKSQGVRPRHSRIRSTGNQRARLHSFHSKNARPSSNAGSHRNPRSGSPGGTCRSRYLTRAYPGKARNARVPRRPRGEDAEYLRSFF